MRVQVELPKQRVQELEDLMRLTGIETKKELINTALTFMAWAVREVKRGRIIVSLDELASQYKQVVLPAFAYAASTTEREREPLRPTDAEWFRAEGEATQKEMEEERQISEVERERQKLFKLLEERLSLKPEELKSLKKDLLETHGALSDTNNGFAGQRV